MESDQKQLIIPLLTALKAEKRAIEYYSRAARRITNPVGKESLKKLKKEEEKHYRDLKAKFKKFAGRPLRSGEEDNLPAAVSYLTEQHLPDKEASDIEVCQIAIKDENNAHGYYSKAAKATDDPEVKKIYEELAKDETGHIATLNNLCKILSAS